MITKVYLRDVRVQLMSARLVETITAKTDQGMSRCWDVYLSALDGERIVRHSSQSPEYDAARALQARGVKGIMEVWRRHLDGTERICSKVNIKKAALAAPIGETPLRVEIAEDIGDNNAWPHITNPEDAAAFELYRNSPEVIARAEKKKAGLASLKAKRIKPSEG
jgi:hypothetical protein